MTKTILTAVSALVFSAGAVLAAGGDHFPVHESGVTAAVDQQAVVDYGTTAAIPDVQKDNVTVQAPEARKWGR